VLSSLLSGIAENGRPHPHRQTASPHAHEEIAAARSLAGRLQLSNSNSSSWKARRSVCGFRRYCRWQTALRL